MRDTTIARNYAEALLALARKADDLAGYGSMMNAVADAMQRDASLRLFLESPRVSAQEKNAVLARAFQDHMPRLFVLYLQTLVKKRRQMLIPQIAVEYASLVDEVEGRTTRRSPSRASRTTPTGPRSPRSSRARSAGTWCRTSPSTRQSSAASWSGSATR